MPPAEIDCHHLTEHPDRRSIYWMVKDLLIDINRRNLFLPTAVTLVPNVIGSMVIQGKTFLVGRATGVEIWLAKS